MVVIERGLERRVEVIVAQTRLTGSPYYFINPSGRVPFLLRDDGVGLEESSVICAFLDQVDGSPVLSLPAGADPWDGPRLEASARSMLDGLSVWLREVSRPQNEQSPTVVQHEAARSARMIDLWESQIDHPLLRSPLNMLHITLACALGLEARIPDFRWRPSHPQLEAWYEQVSSRPSFGSTAPPVSR